MLKNILQKLENPKRPLLGPNVKLLKFWGLLLPKNVFKKYFYLCMHFLETFFIVTAYIDVWFVKSDINLLLNNLKITLFLFWQKNWKSIIDYVTKADLYQRKTTDPKKLELINAFTKYCRKTTYVYWILIYSTIIIVMVQPIIKYIHSESYRENVKNGTESYLQVVSSWVPFDKNTLPGYFAASFYQSFAAIYGGGWITSFDTNAIVIMVFFKAELELLRIDCQDSFGKETVKVEHEVVMSRFKDCHRTHVNLLKFSRLFDSCLSPIMMLYMFMCSVMLCVTAYQITISIETSPMQRFMNAEYLVFGVAQLFIYCWHSNDASYASEDLSLGPYESVSWCKDVRCRKDLYILLAQFNKLVLFTAGPFTDLTVTTFINILKGAYSYYTLLSQSQMN